MTETELLTFISKVLEIDLSSISLDSEYGVLKNWDSLMMIRIIAELEDHLKINISFEEIPKIKKIKDFLRFANGK
jgi:acyl carrier protein